MAKRIIGGIFGIWMALCAIEQGWELQFEQGREFRKGVMIVTMCAFLAFGGLTWAMDRRRVDGT